MVPLSVHIDGTVHSRGADLDVGAVYDPQNPRETKSIQEFLFHPMLAVRCCGKPNVPWGVIDYTLCDCLDGQADRGLGHASYLTQVDLKERKVGYLTRYWTKPKLVYSRSLEGSLPSPRALHLKYAPSIEIEGNGDLYGHG